MPPLGQKSFVYIEKHLENLVGPLLCMNTSGQRQFGPPFRNPKYATVGSICIWVVQRVSVGVYVWVWEYVRVCVKNKPNLIFPLIKLQSHSHYLKLFIRIYVLFEIIVYSRIYVVYRVLK